MRQIIFLSLSVIFAFTPLALKAQFYMDGGESDFIKRYQLERGNFRIIYPQSGDSTASRVADILEYNLPNVNHTSRKYKNFPIVLRHNTPYSNGYVAWTPARMNLYSLSAGESALPTPWLTHLVTHELRHYSQMNALNWKAGHILGYVLGEQSIGILAGFTPRWFLEGDAIYYESANGRIGRLHSATNYQHYRAELLSGQRLSYDQMLNGSYKYYVPNYYDFGALMVEYGYAKYGAELWSEVMNYTTLHFYRIFPFHFALKKYTGNSRHQLFTKALAHLDSTTREQNQTIEKEDLAPYTSELFPHYSPTLQKYFYLQRSYTRWQALYQTNSLTGKLRKSKKVRNIRSVQGSIRYDDTVAAWVQLERQDPRWDREQYANIWLCNLSTGKLRELTYRTMAISPLPNLVKRVVRAIEVQPRGEFALTERRLVDGELQTLVTKPFIGSELRELANGYDANSTLIRAVNDFGTGLYLYHWDTHQIDTILSPIPKDISNLHTDSSGIYFSMSQNYVRRAFFTAWPTDTVQQLSYVQELLLSPYGNENVHPIDSMQILYSAFTINGYRTRLAQRTLGTVLPISELKPELLHRQPRRYADSMHLVHTPTTKNFKPYSQFKDAFHFHSWAPFYYNPAGDIETLRDSKLGLTVASQNTTGTFALTAGYFYDRGHGGALTAEWIGFWPRIWVSGYTDRRSMMYAHPQEIVQQKRQYFTAELGLNFPFSWGKRMYNHSFKPSIVVSYGNNLTFDPLSNHLWEGRGALRLKLAYSVFRLTAQQALYPRLGLVINLTARGTFAPLIDFSKIFEGYIAGYLPGIWRTHAMRFELYTLLQSNALLQQVLRFSKRGMWWDAPYDLYSGKNTYEVEYDYAFPIVHPDFNIYSYFYLKRIAASLFASFRLRSHFDNSYSITRVIGCELYTDFHLFRTQYPFRLGGVVAWSPFNDPLGGKRAKVWSLQARFSTGIGFLESSPTLKL